MSITPLYLHGAVVLCYAGNVASWRVPNPEHQDAKRYDHYRLLVIQCSPTSEDGVHTPAASVTVSGREALLALRAAVDAALQGVEPT